MLILERISVLENRRVIIKRFVVSGILLVVVIGLGISFWLSNQTSDMPYSENGKVYTAADIKSRLNREVNTSESLDITFEPSVITDIPDNENNSQAKRDQYDYLMYEVTVRNTTSEPIELGYRVYVDEALADFAEVPLSFGTGEDFFILEPDQSATVNRAVLIKSTDALSRRELEQLNQMKDMLYLQIAYPSNETEFVPLEVTEPYEQTQTNDDRLSYQTYQTLTERVQDDLNIDGYVFKDTSADIPTATRVNQNLSFGKREWLTRSGDFDAPIEPTQERYFYENEDSSRLLIITIAYTDSHIGNDLIAYNISSGYDINEDLVHSESMILSYKNLVIHVAQNSATPLGEMADTDQAALAVTKYLEQY